MIFLWVHANSAMNKNGIDMNTWEVKPLAAEQGVECVALDVKAPIDANKIEYIVSQNSLPDGLTLNTDGTITGIATAKAGDYTFTVQAKADNWVTAKRDFTLSLTSAFVLDTTEARLNEDFYAVIESDTVNGNNYSQGVVYTLKDGKLPEGLTLSAEGEIEGTPTETGEFTVVLNIAATNVVGSGWLARTTVSNFDYEFTLTVSE